MFNFLCTNIIFLFYLKLIFPENNAKIWFKNHLKLAPKDHLEKVFNAIIFFIRSSAIGSHFCRLCQKHCCSNYVKGKIFCLVL
jgi:hypothetical protein